ncbi:MAG: Xaa-Pro aminopeptidase [Myxococcota bacterium]|nr:Xaa-Pro aminopeptidase [Myxococcota bacterium]MDW8361860.1 Xaa-Pro aminopeptidase [Myxococcales bacterium]
MQHLLERVDTAALRARRLRLMRAAGGRAVLFAGAAPPRNYPANTYPFRASSHFLYVVGVPIERAAVLLEGERFTLYLPDAPADDALWHGPPIPRGLLAERLDCEVRSLDELPAALQRGEVATVPALDAETRALQSRWLGRPVELGRIDRVDERFVDALIDARLRHDEAAVAQLRLAVEATAAAHRAGREAARVGAREWEVRAAMEAELLARHCTTAYPPIVTVHGDVLHERHHHRVLRETDLLLADVGAETAGGWAADVTRTWPVGGRFSPTQRDFYALVLAANEAAIAAVRPGVRFRDVHLVASRVLAAGLVELGVLRGDPDELVADGVHALLFPHGVGHLLGLDVHDMEDLGDRAGYAPGRTRSTQFGLCYLRLDRDLEPGMCVTIEPGLYRVEAILHDPRLEPLARDRLDRDRLARFADVRGIRIEDDVLVTAHGAEVLSAAIPKAPEAVQR